MSYITISTLSLDAVPSGNVSFYVKWRKASDPDIPASYTDAPALTVDPNGNVLPPEYKILVPDTTIIVKAYNFNNCGPGASRDFVICGPITAYQSTSGLTTWEALSATCEKSNRFAIVSSIGGLGTPWAIYYDTPLARMYVLDADNTGSLGNIYWFDPLTAVSSADFTYLPVLAQPLLYTAAVDVARRRIYAAGKNSGGLIVFSIFTGTVTVVPYGTDGTNYNRVSVQLIGDSIYCSDSVAGTIVIINAVTLLVSSTVLVSSIPDNARFSGGGYSFIGVDTEIYVVAGGTVRAIGIYDAGLTSVLGTIDLPAALVWDHGVYWQSAFYDAVSGHVYVSDFGSSTTFVIDPGTRTILATRIHRNRQGKSNAVIAWSLDPLTNELLMSWAAQNTSTDTPIIRIFIESRSTFAFKQSYNGIFLAQSAKVGASSKFLSIFGGTPGWTPLTGYDTDGRIDFLDSAAIGDNTNKQIILTLKEIDSLGVPTGITKDNSPSDPDYIAPTPNVGVCPVTIDLSCPTDLSITTLNGTNFYYEFNLTIGVLNNTAVTQVRISAMNAGVAAATITVAKSTTFVFMSGVLAGVGAGPYTIKVEYLDVSSTVLATCP